MFTSRSLHAIEAHGIRSKFSSEGEMAFGDQTRHQLGLPQRELFPNPQNAHWLVGGICKLNTSECSLSSQFQQGMTQLYNPKGCWEKAQIMLKGVKNFMWTRDRGGGRLDWWQGDSCVLSRSFFAGRIEFVLETVDLENDASNAGFKKHGMQRCQVHFIRGSETISFCFSKSLQNYFPVFRSKWLCQTRLVLRFRACCFLDDQWLGIRTESVCAETWRSP